MIKIRCGDCGRRYMTDQKNLRDIRCPYCNHDKKLSVKRIKEAPNDH